MKLTLPALRSRNYRLFFSGQGISVIGTWMTQVSTVWLVYQLTNSPLMLGLTGFIGQIPSFVLTPFGGIINPYILWVTGVYYYIMTVYCLKSKTAV